MNDNFAFTIYEPIFKRVREASRQMPKVHEEKINALLLSLAEETEKKSSYILSENQKDLDLMDPNDPKYDRLKLTEKRIKTITSDIRNVVRLPSPLGKTLYENERSNGLKISKITVPLGVVGIIYEARPNVTFDVFSLCFKSGNACLLKGGSDARFSNEAVISIIKMVLSTHNIDPFIAELLPVEREATQALLTARGYVDVIIPRGSQSLIDYVTQNSKIPVIETGAGIVHTYLDETANLIIAKEIVNNAKTRRVSVCNALDCLLVHKDQLMNLPEVLEPLAKSNVLIFADNPSKLILEGHYPKDLLQPSTEESYGTEFLSYKMSIKTVNDLDEALTHIDRYGSKHSEAIISENIEHIERFLNEVDAAAVYSNTSTAFTDGSQFGLGAEIGISTQKLHARGPMALSELTSYKWVVRGSGQIRE